MPIGTLYPFAEEEVQKVQKGPIYEQPIAEDDTPGFDETAAARAAGTERGVMENFSASIDYLLKKLCSDNLYENPVTNQRFEIKVVCDTVATQDNVRDRLEVAARVDPVDAPVTEGGTLNVVDGSIDDLDQEAVHYLAASTDGNTPEEVIIQLRVLDTGNVNPPYRVSFLYMPTTSDTLNDSGNIGVQERGSSESFDVATSINYPLPPCVQPTIFLTGLNVSQGNKIGAYLSWSDGTDPGKEDDRQLLAPVKEQRRQRLSGRNRQSTVDNFVLNVQVQGQGRYRVEGNYV